MIRVKEKDKILTRICIKVTSRIKIRIRIKVTSMIQIRIKLMRIHNTGCEAQHRRGRGWQQLTVPLLPAVQPKVTSQRKGGVNSVSNMKPQMVRNITNGEFLKN
jgi:hypothetical protein